MKNPYSVSRTALKKYQCSECRKNIALGSEYILGYFSWTGIQFRAFFDSAECHRRYCSKLADSKGRIKA